MNRRNLITRALVAIILPLLVPSCAPNPGRRSVSYEWATQGRYAWGYDPLRLQQSPRRNGYTP